MTPTIRNARRCVIALLVSAPVIVGCDAQPPTNSEDVADYVRNARAGGHSRRLDEAAQDYADQVLKAHAAWQKACASIAGISDSDALWKLDGKEWRDAAKVAERLQTVFAFHLGAIEAPAGSADSDSTGKDDPSGNGEDMERVKTHSALYNALRKAVKDVPAGLTGETGELAGRVLQLLEPELGDLENARRRYAEIAAEYRELLMFLLKNAGGIDLAGKGLTFANPAATDEAKRLWSKLNERFKREHDREIASLESILADELELRGAALEEKKALRQRGISSEADRRKMRQLELLVHYYDARQKSAEKRKRKLDQKAEADSAQK
ncbi:MAG: hypothetical protein O7D94_08305 [Planctomycetota bacterium]|nr:hypothetical protein [Planctomycetota bacterium]